jgi:hypothetical protein
MEPGSQVNGGGRFADSALGVCDSNDRHDGDTTLMSPG